MNVLVYRRAAPLEGPRLVCRLPVFEPGASASENSLIGFGRSIVVENNYGYDLFPRMMFGRTGAGGVTRIDIDENGRGCELKWQSGEISQTVVPKLSLANGLVYLYTKLAGAPIGIDAYYLTAVDFETGQTVFRVLTGTGVGYDNHWAPITLGRDGTAYVGTLRGLVAVRDRSAAR
jgi:outer membrane protein assembly factor BamB